MHSSLVATKVADVINQLTLLHTNVINMYNLCVT